MVAAFSGPVFPSFSWIEKAEQFPWPLETEGENPSFSFGCEEKAWNSHLPIKGAQ
jgi:hypothetical protein